jgi:hypothetical protein
MKIEAPLQPTLTQSVFGKNCCDGKFTETMASTIIDTTKGNPADRIENQHFLSNTQNTFRPSPKMIVHFSAPPLCRRGQKRRFWPVSAA